MGQSSYPQDGGEAFPLTAAIREVGESCYHWLCHPQQR